MLNSIGTGLLNQINYCSSKANNALGRVFADLSFSMGGDGKSVTKKQLNDYIQKAESGAVKVSDKKLSTLKNVEKNWDDIVEDKELLSMEDFQRNIGIFLPIFMDPSSDGNEVLVDRIQFYKNKALPTKTIDKEELEKRAEKLEKTQEKTQEETETTFAEKSTDATFMDLSQKVNAKEDGITKQDLKTYLKDLLKKESTSEDDYSVDYITNLIADFDDITGGKEHMTSMKKEIEYTV